MSQMVGVFLSSVIGGLLHHCFSHFHQQHVSHFACWFTCREACVVKSFLLSSP